MDGMAIVSEYLYLRRVSAQSTLASGLKKFHSISFSFALQKSIGSQRRKQLRKMQLRTLDSYITWRKSYLHLRFVLLWRKIPFNHYY